MLNVFVIGLGVVLSIFMEWGNYKQWDKRNRRVFIIGLLISGGLAMAYFKGISIPNPLNWLTDIYRPISDSYVKFMEKNQ